MFCILVLSVFTHFCVLHILKIHLKKIFCFTWRSGKGQYRVSCRCCCPSLFFFFHSCDKEPVWLPRKQASPLFSPSPVMVEHVGRAGLALFGGLQWRILLGACLTAGVLLSDHLPTPIIVQYSFWQRCFLPVLSCCAAPSAGILAIVPRISPSETSNICLKRTPVSLPLTEICRFK